MNIKNISFSGAIPFALGVTVLFGSLAFASLDTPNYKTVERASTGTPVKSQEWNNIIDNQTEFKSIFTEIKTWKDSLASAFTINADGNMGIGTTEPKARLEIKGNASTEVGMIINEDAEIGVPDGQDFEIVHTNPTTGAITERRFEISSNGNVGIGTSSPSNKLTVRGMGDVTGFEDVAGNDGILLEDSNFYTTAAKEANPDTQTHGGQLRFDANELQATWRAKGSTEERAGGFAINPFGGTVSVAKQTILFEDNGSIRVVGGGVLELHQTPYSKNGVDYAGGNYRLNVTGTNSFSIDQIDSSGNNADAVFSIYDDKVVHIDSLKGAGNAFVCVNASGNLYRSTTACN